jgi:hypothetical protein
MPLLLPPPFFFSFYLSLFAFNTRETINSVVTVHLFHALATEEGVRSKTFFFQVQATGAVAFDEGGGLAGSSSSVLQLLGDGWLGRVVIARSE